MTGSMAVRTVGVGNLDLMICFTNHVGYHRHATTVDVLSHHDGDTQSMLAALSIPSLALLDDLLHWSMLIQA